MRLGVAQIHTRPGDLAGTAERIAAQAEAAAAREADLLVLPLPTLAGPTPVPPSFLEEFALDASRMLASLAAELRCPCLVPLLFEVDGLPVLDAALVGAGDVTLLRGADRVLDAAAPIVFDHAGARVGLAFSYDALEDVVPVAESLDVLICLSDLEFSVDDAASALGASVDPRLGMLAVGSRAWLVTVAPVGGYGSQVFLGASFALAPNGALAAVAASWEEELLVVDTEADVYARELTPVPYDDRYHLWQALVSGTRDHVAALGAADVVLGLDGTVSSAVLAVVASDALGPTHVHALVAKDDAHAGSIAALVDNLHVDLLAVDVGERLSDVERADRMQLALASTARERGAVVLSSADKTGLALDADGTRLCAAGFAPLADVLRSDLLAAAHLRNAISPVFPSLALGVDDVPALAGGPFSTSGESLLECVDDVIAAYVSGDPGLCARVDPPLTSAVLALLRDRASWQGAAIPLLVMSSCTLYEARLPPGFGWRPSLGPLAPSPVWEDVARRVMGWTSDDADAGGSTGSEGTVEATGDPPSSSDVRGALRETLDLLRDLSMGGAGDWQTPFSEN